MDDARDHDRPDLDPALLRAARTARRVAVLTGAGMSAESGVPTFREPGEGFWSRWSPEELATPEAWEDDPQLVWSWYLWRARRVRALAPHAGHRALAAWSRGARVEVVTQNVDDLHERAGSEVLAHLHGSLFAFRCAGCAAPYPTERVPGLAPAAAAPGDEPRREHPPACPSCGGPVRPGVVWFGELLPEGALDRAAEAVAAAELVVVVGTSGLVQPAASLPLIAAGRGIPVVEIDPRDTALTPHADFAVRAGAARALPLLVPGADPASR
ncbi:NAD-dependent protein deacylase [Kocuria sp. LUK]|uniref:NAD-dependent protein deacylase n=1 Tax=Kocuria sp. LUK TaxID=2897828 RepID=UPI002103501B|nr:NAD-dependent protein deacylase [Kocuria sp. LUK]